MPSEFNIPNCVSYLNYGNNFTPGVEQDCLYYDNYQNGYGNRHITFGLSQGSARSRENRADYDLLNSTVDMQHNSDNYFNFNARHTGVSSRITLGPMSIRSKIGNGEFGGTLHSSSNGSEIGIRANAQLASVSFVACNGLGFSASSSVGFSADTGARARFGKNWAFGGEVAGIGGTLGRTTKISLPWWKSEITWY